ncbi:DUF393 domain-containing protein [bacterium]|nr:DUF393 domain-containing protein [bacterium]
MPATGPPVLIYDGQCPFCRGTVSLLQAWERPGSLRYAPALSDEGRALLARHGLEAETLGAVVLIDGEDLWQASDAVWRAASRLRWPYKALMHVRWMPRALREWAYGLIARMRPRDDRSTGGG